MFDFLNPAPADQIDGSPLVQVIAQVKFPSQQLLATPAGVGQLHEMLSEDYPRLLSEPQTLLTAGPSGASSTSVPQWRMTDLESTWAVVVSPEYLSVETTSYTTWPDMRSKLRFALDGLSELTSLRVRERVGLRYVNQLPSDDTGGYDSVIRESLLGFLADERWRHNLTLAMSQTLVADGTVQLLVRHGTGSAVVGDSNVYVIDIDCYDDAPVAFDLKAVLGEMDELNDVALRCFYACMVDGFGDHITVKEGSQ